ncbi:hypothetical protein TWF281_003711 [Arthrobotrys megalospora]
MDSLEEPCFINLLPAELLYRIFTTIDDPQTLCRAERTCHRWRSIIDSQALWRNLATKLSSARILPERFNELGKGSLITGRYIVDSEGGRWNYLYRDLVRNIHSFNRIPNINYHKSLLKQSNDNPGVVFMDYGPQITQVISSMPELSELPDDYAGSKDAYVTRRIDFASSAVEGMRLQPRPLVISKTPPFTDSLCPGETSFDETSWVYFADQLIGWPRPHSNIVFETPPAAKIHATVQKGVIRAGTKGVFDEGTWPWPEAKPSKELEEELAIPSAANDTTKPSSSEQKRPWKDGDRPKETKASVAEEIAMLSATEIAPIYKKPTPSVPPPPAHVKWAAPIDSANTLPHSRRWDENHTVFSSYRNAFNLTRENNSECQSPFVVESIINTLYGEMQSQAHSDPNLRISYRRLKGTFPDIMATIVDRLALPPSQSIQKDASNPIEPVPVVNQTWHLFGGARWSLNSVPFISEADVLEIEGSACTTNSASEPWWIHETRFKADSDEPPNIWESAHKWEYRSCGDYLIISDDIGMSGPCTISCFKAGYHTEKSTVDPKTYLRGAALRNYLAAGPASDLIWQKSLKHGGYILDEASSSPVYSLQHPDFPSTRPSYFLDNDGLSLNSKVIVYAARKKVFFLLDANNVAVGDVSAQALTCMEFHIIAIENGQTINILDLEHETRTLGIFEGWYGWASFVISDTHLMATVGGNVHDSQGAEHEDDHVARTWVRGNRYGREEVFIWPLDVPDQNLSLPPEQRKILPTGRLGIGFNGYRWWQRDRFLSLSRDGRFLAVSSKYTLVVWDLWLGDSKGVIYYFDGQSNGLQGYGLSRVADVACNGIWVQYRDIIVDPNHKTLTRSNPNYEHELLKRVMFIPNGEARLLLKGANFDFEQTDEGKRAVKELESRLGRRYIPTDSDSSSDSDSWETDDDGDEDYEDDDDDDSDDYDSDGGGFRRIRYADDDDYDEEDYDHDYGSGGSDDDDEGSDDSDSDSDSDEDMEGYSVQRAARPSESRTQTLNLRKRKLETTEAGASGTSAAAGTSGSSRQDPVPVIGWGVEEGEGGGDAKGWGTDNEDGGVDTSW